MTNESDTYAQAEPGKAPGSTFERKEMSFKTLRKRIALVAVSALAVTGLSTVPASATKGDAIAATDLSAISVTAPTSPTAGAPAAFTIGITSAANFVLTTNDGVAIRARIDSAPTGGVSAFTGAFVATTNWENGSGAVGASGVGKLTAVRVTSNFASGSSVSLGTLTFTPSKAGDYSITFYHDQDLDSLVDGNEVYNTARITVGAANGYSNNVSTLYANNLNTDANATAANAKAPTRDKAMNAARGGTITATLNTATNTDAKAFVASVDVVVSGAGYVATLTAGANPGTNGCPAAAANSPTRSVTVASPANQVQNFAVCSDGTAGTGTYTVRVTNTDGVSFVLGTVTATFTDAAVNLALVKTNYTVAPAGGGNVGFYTTMGTRDAATKIPSAILKTTDTAGNAVTHSNTPSGLSSNLAILTGGTCAVDDGNALGSGGAGFYNCYVTSTSSAKSGDKATITWRVLNADGVTYTTLAAIEHTVGGTTPAKVTLSFDKATYAPGEAAKLTITATDASNNPVADSTYANMFDSTYVKSNLTATGLPTASSSVVTAGGKATINVNAPVAGQSWTASAVLGTSVATAAIGSTISATAAIASAADAQIASLIAAIAKLQKAINKIQKRLNR